MPATLNIFNDTELGVWQITRANTLWKNQLTFFHELHDYPAVNRFMRRTDEEAGGTQLEWHAIIDESGNAEWMNEADPKTYNVTDNWAKFSTQWKLISAYYLAFRSEIKAQMDAGGDVMKLQDLLNGRRCDAQVGIAAKLEARLWSVPAGSDEEKAKQPYGIPYSIVPITGAQVTAATWGFQGANHTSYSSCYGVDSSLNKYRRYRNYNDVWSSDLASNELSEDDIDKITQMVRYLNWKGPTNAQQFMAAQAAPRLEFWTTNRLIKLLERKARANNDSLGADLGKFSGQVVTKGIPYNWAETLDADTSNPLYAIDLDSFRTIVRKGERFTENGPDKLPNQHRTFKTDVDLVLANVNKNRRKCGMISYVAAG